MGAAEAGVWEWHPATNTSVWSDEIWRLFGLSPDACAPSFKTWLRTIDPDHRAGAARAWQDAVADGREFQLEWRAVARERAFCWLMVRGAPLCGTDGSVKSYRGVVIDITARKATEERIRYLAHHDSLTVFESVPRSP